MKAEPDFNPARDPQHYLLARRRALRAWAALLLLLLASAASAQLHWGGMNLVVSLAIAAVKIGLVGWIYMSLGEPNRLPRLAIATGILILAVMVGLGGVDALTRRDESTHWQLPKVVPAQLSGPVPR